MNYFHKLKSVGGGPDTIVSHDDSDDLPRESDYPQRRSVKHDVPMMSQS